MKSRIALPALALLIAGGCASSDVTSPLDVARRSAIDASTDEASSASQAIEITYEKWFTTYPAMTGNTSYGDGTFSGRLLRRTAFDNGVIVQLEALYTVTDPSTGRTFTAHVEGKENLVTLTAVLNGEITEGAMTGARVHVEFTVISPCALATGPSVKNTCFQGTIRVQPQE